MMVRKGRVGTVDVGGSSVRTMIESQKQKAIGEYLMGRLIPFQLKL